MPAPPIGMSIGAEARQEKRLLVVDDDDDIRETVAEVLSDQGYVVDTARNGREALDCLHRVGPSAPCLVLLDLMMPVMNGFEVLESLMREGGGEVPVPVVVLSAFLPSQPPPGAVRAQRKPVSLSALLNVVNDVCGPPPAAA